MKIVFIAGPYFSGGDPKLIRRNIRNAERVMIAIANRFAIARTVGFFCPHSHTRNFEIKAKAPESYYQALDLALLESSAIDGLILLPGWQNSSGTKRELECARNLGKPVFELAAYGERELADLLEKLALFAEEEVRS